MSLQGALAFAGLFVPVWWVWAGFTFYADRFDTDDVPYRVCLLAAMLAIGALAVNVRQAATGFAVAYVGVRAVS